MIWVATSVAVLGYLFAWKGFPGAALICWLTFLFIMVLVNVQHG